MPAIKRLVVSITTAADGSATGYIGDTLGGLLQQIVYVPDATTPYENTVTFTITENDTGRAVLTTGAIAAAVTAFMPRDATTDILNAPSYYAGAAHVNATIPIVGNLKIVLANGGNAKTGKLYAYFA